jgi:tetratricopeptide (TPR) repeat protein
MIAHVLYRNRKFMHSMQYLALLLQNMTHKKSYEQQFYPKYVLLLAANYVFTGQNTKAVELLEQFLLTNHAVYETRDMLNAQLNLAFYYFQQEEYSKANKQLRTITHSDQWCEKKMGKEWVLKKNLSELIIQYEIGNEDLAMNKVRAIERSYGNLFKNPAYKNVQVYIQFIKRLLHDPGAVTGETFLGLVDSSFVFLPATQEDLQSMGFYAWLKSKMQNRKYYEVLLELANS